MGGGEEEKWRERRQVRRKKRRKGKRERGAYTSYVATCPVLIPVVSVNSSSSIQQSR